MIYLDKNSLFKLLINIFYYIINNNLNIYKIYQNLVGKYFFHSINCINFKIFKFHLYI